MKLSFAILKGIAIGGALIAVASLTSCAGLKLATPYGDAYTDAKGNLVIAPIAKPITIPLGEK